VSFWHEVERFCKLKKRLYQGTIKEPISVKSFVEFLDYFGPFSIENGLKRTEKSTETFYWDRFRATFTKITKFLSVSSCR